MAVSISDRIVNADCIDFMRAMPDRSVDFTLTDIPYDAVNRESGGLRLLDKGRADAMAFDLHEFLDHVWRVSSGSVAMFCGKEQFSGIYAFFAGKSGTVRPIVWEKANPSPMNGKSVYLSGVELGVWFKRRGGCFNAFCKNTVFRFPNGKSVMHPTEKNHGLLRELILDNTEENDVVFDPCAGSGSHLLMAKSLGRGFLGCEIDRGYYGMARSRLSI